MLPVQTWNLLHERRALDQMNRPGLTNFYGNLLAITIRILSLITYYYLHLVQLLMFLLLLLLMLL